MAKRKRRRITKKELKEDRFLESAADLLYFLKHHSSKLVWGLLGVFVIFLSTRYFIQSRAKGEEEATFAFTSANSFLFAGRYQDARTKYEEILQKYPSTTSGVKSLYYLGNLCYFLSEYDSSLDYYERYLAKSKDPLLAAAALEGIGYCYEQKGDLQEAARRYEEVFERHPKSIVAASALISAARCYESLGNFESAEGCYERVIGSFPETQKAEEARKNRAFLKGMQAATAR